jgi:hypothetical protein
MEQETHRKATAMPPDRIDPDLGQREPGYWLVAGLEWPGGTVAEAAFATAPELIPRQMVSHDAIRYSAAPTFTQPRMPLASCSSPT